MKQFSILLVILVSLAVVAQADIPANGCYFKPGSSTTQVCWLTEGASFDVLNPEPPVVVTSLFAPDLQVGYITIGEPGGGVSDYVTFTASSGSAFADTITLYSGDIFGNFPWGNSGPPSGLTEITVDAHNNPLNLVEGPEPCFGCVVSFDLPQGISGQYIDTFNVISDVPEPGAIVLLGSVTVLLASRLRRRRA